MCCGRLAGAKRPGVWHGAMFQRPASVGTVQLLKDAVQIAIDYRGRRRVLARQYAFRLVGRVAPVIAVDTEVGRFFVSTGDLELGRNLFAGGGHDDVEGMERVLAYLGGRAEGFALRGRVLLDIGANVGTTTVAALARFGVAHVYAFEPAPLNHALLEQNLVVNGLQGRATAVQAAVSDSDGVVELLLSPTNFADHRVHRSSSENDVLGRDAVTVEAATLDTLVRKYGIDLDAVGLVWIDTQGHEPSVLAGATAVIEAGVPFVVEYWPFGLGRDGLERFESLVRERFTHWADMRSSGTRDGLVARPAADIGALRSIYTGEMFTDLVLTR
jgi:FkbM family methyltransferase